MLAKPMQHGEGFFGDLWDKVIKPVGGFLKDSKILSTVGSLIPHPGVQAGARMAGQLGFSTHKTAMKNRKKVGGAKKVGGGKKKKKSVLKF